MTRTDWERTTVEHDGLTFEVTVAGPEDAPPVLLLHGFPQSSRSWWQVVDRLEPDHRLLVPDQRGYSPGARPTDVSAYDVRALAGDALAVAAGLGHDRVHVVGHDWGASVGWQLAALHAPQVLSLTALSIPHLAAFGRAVAEDPEQRRLSAYLADFRRPGHEEQLLADDARELRAIYDGVVDPDDVDHYVELMADGALTPALGWYRAMGRDLGRMPAVAVPTTYVWGEADRATSEAAATGCRAHVEGDYRFVRLPGVSHWSPDEVPDVVADEVRRRVSGAA
ncbi:MAG: dehH1 [Marmoricola sp.]|nr:dehH1 [Marmoricola sp.]